MAKSLTYELLSDVDFENEDTFDLIAEELENSEFTFGDGIGTHLISGEEIIKIIKDNDETEVEKSELKKINKAMLYDVEN